MPDDENDRPAVVLGAKLIGKVDSICRADVAMRFPRSSISVGILFVALWPRWAQAQNQAAGRALYDTYCSACHGEKGKGDGAAARALPVKPTDHTNGAIMNQLSDKFLVEVISRGGSAVGKSSFMPAWSGSLNESQIRDMVAYIRAIAVPSYKPESPRKK